MLTRSIASDNKLWFSQMAPDITQLIRQMLEPGIVVFSKSVGGRPSLFYRSLTEANSTSEHFVGDNQTFYGNPVPYLWRSPTAMVTQKCSPTDEHPSSDLVVFDYATRRLYPSTMSFIDKQYQFLPGPVVSLTSTHTLVAQKNETFVIMNSETMKLQATSIVFGSRNNHMRMPRFSARDYRNDGFALLAGSDGDLLYYCAMTNSCTELGYPEQSTANKVITSVTSIPNTSIFLAGAGNRLFGYDFRASYAPTFAFDMIHLMSGAAAMYSENGFVSWNDFSYVWSAGKGYTMVMNQHCQRLDIRSGCEDVPEWNLPSHLRPLWASSVVYIPT